MSCAATRFGARYMPIPKIEDLHGGLRALLEERVDVEPVILAARAGMGSDALAATMLAETNGFLLDALAAGDDPAVLAHQLTRRVIARMQPLGLQALREAGREADKARVALAHHYEGELAPALSAAGSPLEAAALGWTVTRALGGGPPDPLLVIREAHRLPAPTLWELRELATQGVRLLLLTTPEHRTQLYGHDAPLYGMAAYLDMPVVPRANWQMKVGHELSAEALGELLRVTRARTAITLEILERHGRQGGTRPVGFAFFEAVDARDHQARDTINLARSVHELAPRLLLALAAGEAPYGLRDTRSDRVALALRRLRQYDLIEQEQPRSWQISDPLLSVAIARLREGEDHVELFPDVGVDAA